MKEREMPRRDWLAGGATTSLDGQRVWYRVDGDGPTLLLAHGYPTSSHDYAPLVRRLRHRFRCVSFDFLGFGASDKPRREYTYALQHQVLGAVVQAAGVQRAVLVAHDYAVTPAQELVGGLAPAPFSLAGVIFLNGGLDAAQHRPRPIQRFLASRLGAAIGPLLLRRRAVLRAFGEVIVRRETVDEDAVWASISEGGGLAVMPRLLHYMAERRLRRDALVEALRAPRVPIAFAWGLDDPVSGAHMLAAFGHALDDAPKCTLQGVGHYPQVEAAGEVAAFVERVAEGWLAAAPAATPGA